MLFFCFLSILIGDVSKALYDVIYQFIIHLPTWSMCSCGIYTAAIIITLTAALVFTSRILAFVFSVQSLLVIRMGYISKNSD